MTLALDISGSSTELRHVKTSGAYPVANPLEIEFGGGEVITLLERIFSNAYDTVFD